MTSVKVSRSSSSEVIIVGLLEVVLGLLGHILEDYGGLGHQVLSDQARKCKLYGVVDLFLGGADQDQVQGSGDLGLEGFGGGEVAEELSEDVEDVSGGHE